jgi:hypothetical protein
MQNSETSAKEEFQQRERTRTGTSVREYDVMQMYLENSITCDRGIFEGEIARRPRKSQTPCLHAKNIICMLARHYEDSGLSV